MDDPHPLIHWRAEVSPLRRPVLLVALDGFIDAGNAASAATMFLRHRWRSEVVATFDRDAFLDFRARRPTVVVDHGVLRSVEFPDLELCAAPLGETASHDALLLLGPEPDMRWERFCDLVADLCRDLGVESVLTVGAYPAAAPHTRPVRITRVATPGAEDLVPAAHPVPGYNGPVGGQTVLQHYLGHAGVPAVGIFAEVPHYIAASQHPASALALVRLLATTLQVEVDTGELEAAAKLQDEQIDEAVADHLEAQEMIAALERHVDSGDPAEDLPSGDDLAAEIERFLSERDS